MRRVPVLLALRLAGCAPQPDPADAAIDLSSPAEAAFSGCRPACGGATPSCNASGHCVGCGRDEDCPAGTICRVSSETLAECAPGCKTDAGCGPSKLCCGGRCVDGTSDPAHCGSCGTACPATHASASCVAGHCALGACDPGYGDCNHDPKDGCESGLHVDPANCGACGTVCAIPHAVAGCADTCYLASCTFGWADCDRDAKNGCEVPVDSDLMNCGDCGEVCPVPPHSTPGCAAARCGIGQCDPGWADCDGDARNGCEAGVDFDSRNCGACGQACPPNLPACGKGKCGLVYHSCLDISLQGKPMGDGVYTIDPTGGQAPPIKVYCDMTTDGGGWTLVHKNDTGSTADRTDAGWNVAALLDPKVNGVAILPRATIAAISPASEFRAIATNGYKIYSLGGMPYYTTDNHTGMTYKGKMKYDWNAPYVDQMPLTIMPGNMHGSFVCPSVNGCTGGDTGHFVSQRWCCGGPNAGLWFNGAQRFAAGYYAGAGWVR